MSDEDFMKIAIEEAKKGYAPFGAIIVKENKIIAQTHNTSSLDPTAHAEVNAIRQACKKLNSKDLSGCTLYATCEPCPMCFTAAWWANISKIVYGTEGEEVPEDDWKIDVKCTYLNEKSGNKMIIKNNVLRDKCLELFK